MALPDTVGIHDIKVDTSVGVVDVTLSLPGDRPEGELPLVLVLHYAGQPTEFYGHPLLEHLIVPGFQGLDAIIVAPTSLGGDWQQAQNRTAIFEILAKVEQNYGTDPDRRVITGYSMGAIGTWLISYERANYFSAAIPIAGFPASLPACEIPTYAIVSDRDEIFPYSRFEQALAAESSSQLAHSVVSGAGHYQINAFTSALSEAVKWLRTQW
ncbi:MAG: hypothetical protein AAF387_03150 [Pseudomonadota bacterium]